MPPSSVTVFMSNFHSSVPASALSAMMFEPKGKYSTLFTASGVIEKSLREPRS